MRPTRGATVVVPEAFDNQICSTGFTVLRCHEDIDPYFLQFVLRLPSTLEQFRKFSTGSSYPAILDSDVLKALVPFADAVERGKIVRSTVTAISERNRIVREADAKLNESLKSAESILRRPNENQDFRSETTVVGSHTVDNVSLF